jgi:hypothetical protein
LDDSCCRELDITATDLSSQVLTDVLTRIPALTWLAAGQLDGMTDEVQIVFFYYSSVNIISDT